MIVIRGKYWYGEVDMELMGCVIRVGMRKHVKGEALKKGKKRKKGLGKVKGWDWGRVIMQTWVS